MSKVIFITGTHTGVGKTTICCGLMHALQQAGFSVLGLKPIASGCDETAEGLRNSDALQLLQMSSIVVDYDTVNPLSFLPPIAPHIAAEQRGEILSVQRLQTLCQPGLSLDVDFILVEGVGGWMVPLNRHETMADFVKMMGWPVVLVVGMQLGCLNHALLTVEKMREQGVTLVGWVANYAQPDMLCAEENLHYLQSTIKAPCLGVIDYNTEM